MNAARAAPGLARVLLLIGMFMLLVQIHRSGGAVIANELTAQGYAPSQIATVVSMLFLASALFQLPTGMMFDRYGARLTLAGLGALGIVGIVLFAMSDSVAGLSAGRFLIGVGHGGTISGVYMLALTWVAADRLATTTGAVVAIAGGIGGILATTPLVLSLHGWGLQRTFLAVAVLTTVVTIAVGVFIRDAPPGADSGAAGRGESLAQSLRGLWAVLSNKKLWPLFAMGSCFSMPFNTVGGLWAGPYLWDVYSTDKTQTSLVILAMVAAFHVGNLLYGPLQRAVGSQKRTIVAGVLVMIVLLLLLAVGPGLGLTVTIVLLVLFCLCAPFYPVLAAHCRDFVPLSRAGRAIACVNLMGLTMVFIMQKLSGWMVEFGASVADATAGVGYRLVFVCIALILSIAVAGYLRVGEAPR
ncbi:MAG: MFS family permease [Gammaproteobacteria bacterium]